MRLAYIVSRFPKISETFVLNEMQSVVSLGASVDLYPLLRERQSVMHPEALDWLRRARFRGFLSPSVAYAQAYFLARRPVAYVRLLIEVLAATWGSRRFFLGALGTFPKAVRFAYEMRRDGVDHVHAHFANNPAVAAFVIHRLTGIPFSFTAHGSDLHVERRMLTVKVEAAAFVVTVSRFNREVIVQECGEAVRDKIHIIHCGIDAGAFAPPSTDRPREPLQIACVASLELVKGHQYLIEACRILRDRGVQFHCHLVGEGPMRGALQDQITRCGLGGRVHLLGPCSRTQVARVLSMANVAVLASHPTKEGKREGIPVALMEAMASGTPVIGTAISGIPELVRSEISGLLVPSGDPLALADALDRLRVDRELADRLGRAGRDVVLREFNLQASALELLRLVAQRRPPSGARPTLVRVRGASPAPAAIGVPSARRARGDAHHDLFTA